jgi:hypothetical protein
MKLSEGTTLSQIANKLNISYAQIRNLKDLKVDKPTFTTAIKFFIMLRTERDQRSQLMKEDYPEMYKHEQEQEERMPAGTIDPEHNLKTSKLPMTYRIYALANCDYGIERQTIKEVWGSEGENTLNEFITAEILREQDGHISSFSEKHRDTDREIIKQKQGHCLSFLDINDPDSWLSLATQSVSTKAYQEIRAASKEFFYTINTIITDPKSRGQVPLFFTMNLGKLLRRNNT